MASQIDGRSTASALGLGLAFLVGCGSASDPVRSAAQTEAPLQASPAAAAPTATPFDGLDPSMTFGAFVSALRKRGHGGGDRCLFGRDGDLLSFRAKLELDDAHARGLVDPAADIDQVLTTPATGGARLFTSWGSTVGGFVFDLIALTPVPKTILRRDTHLLAVTDRGIYRWKLGVAPPAKLLSPEDIEILRSTLVSETHIWIVTAEAGVPIGKLLEPLEWLKNARHGEANVVLAAPLPQVVPGHTMPPSRYESILRDPKEPMGCQWLEREPARGRFTSEQWAALSPLVDPIGKACGKSLSPGSGGEVSFYGHVSADATKVEVCAETDDTGSLEARRCVVDGIGKLAFPAPANVNDEAVIEGRLLVVGPPIHALCD